MKKSALFIVIGLCVLVLPVRAQINLLHEFGIELRDGEYPYGSLIVSGSTIFGMTHAGGDSGYGTIFKIETDGTGFVLLHEFTGAPADGGWPRGSLIISDSTLYGMTSWGGEGFGIVFKLGITGSDFTILHSFAGGAEDGLSPEGSLIISGSILYGMTRFGGDNNEGTIFKIETNGDGFALLHEFSGYPEDGRQPIGSLIISGTTLYGMTHYGGVDGYGGTIFKIETNGTGFAELHEFASDYDKSENPRGSLIISGTSLFGMTNNGGVNRKGTIFKIETNNTGFTVLHQFSGSAADGAFPNGSLFISSATLYGMTYEGGDSDIGTLFKIQTDGSSFSLLHSFVGGTVDGAAPKGDILLSDSIFYGMTEKGGDNNKGVIFSMPLPTIALTSPNGGESWPRGSSKKITWDHLGLTDKVRLVLFRDNAKVGPIATVPVTEGSYNWAAGAYSGGTAVAAKNYKIKIVTADGLYSDWSDAKFTLSLDPYARVRTPNGGESWAEGGIQAITWEARGLTGDVKLILYDGSVKVGRIDTVNVSQEGYNWMVGEHVGGLAPAGRDYRIKIMTPDGQYIDYSDNAFTITADGG